MDGLMDLFNNKLFLQYLSGAGADIAVGNPIGQNVNAITQQNIQSQNFMKLLQQMLGPDDFKGSFDKSGMTLKIPSTNSWLKSLLGSGDQKQSANASMSMGDLNTPVPSTGSTPNLQGNDLANPFVSSQPLTIRAADLAGLTPENIMAVLGAKQTQRQQDIKNYLDYQKMNREEKTTAVQNYEYAQTPAGGGFKGTFMEFQDAAKTAHQKDYEAAVASGYSGGFNTWLHDLTRSGATTINIAGAVEKEKALSEIKGQTYFNDPGWVDDIGKHIGSEDVQNELFQSKDPAKYKATETVKYIEGKIKAGGGDITGVEWDKDGKTMVWTVKWPSGDTKKIKYTVR